MNVSRRLGYLCNVKPGGVFEAVVGGEEWYADVDC